ncbi:P protein-like isoform X1 [Montipora foliosa]|uniref:P protein-like isoform X1 n=2 Tax=Montipora foliosa TaxID=591990 RepID=UPI0035F2093F
MADALSSSPALRSCQSDSPVFLSPRSLSPRDEILQRENTETSEITPLITDENHYGTAADTNELVSMSPDFRGSSSSYQAGEVSKWRNLRDASKKIKPWFFFLVAVTFAVFFATNGEVSEKGRLFAISDSFPEYMELNCRGDSVVTVVLTGPFAGEDQSSASEFNLTVALINRNGNVTNSIIKNRTVGLNSSCVSSISESFWDPISITATFDNFTEEDNITHLMFTLNTSFPIAVSMKHFLEPVSQHGQIIIALVILLGVYILIIFELVHRATAAMLGSLAALSALSYVNKRPTMETILTWVEWETLFLLFGMMILVAVFAKTGFFDYIALKAYKLSRGHVWWLITLLCVCTAITSAFLDNVTVILLITPVTVTLCQVLNLNPTYILIAEVIFANIGGTATAIGDPPNVILVASKELSDVEKIEFGEFTMYLCVGILFCLIVAYVVLRLLYRNVKIVNDDPPIIEEMKREAEIWKRSADRLTFVSAEDKTVKLLLLQKAMTIENRIRNMKRQRSRAEAFQQSLQQLERKYVIRDKELLVKSSIVIGLVIILLFVHSLVHHGLYLGVGWIAMLGAILLILLADISHFEELMEQVEWTTLVFFSGLFILMKSLDELGLMPFLGRQTSTLIQTLTDNFSDRDKMGIALIVIVWVSALVSSFIDNIPFTTAMIPVILELHRSNGLELKPLVWALAMGSCLGGNGTLIGASANVVCSGLSEQYGYPITFNTFFRVGFLIMLATTATATVYLLLSNQGKD